MNGMPVNEVQVHYQGAQVKLVAQHFVIHPSAKLVSHQVVAPGGTPALANMAVPVQVVGIGVLCARRNGGGAELQAYVLARSRCPRARDAKCIVLVHVGDKGAVVVDVDGRGVNFVASQEDGLLAGRDGPVGIDLPLEPQEIRGVEGVLLVNLLVEPLPYADGEVVRDVAHDVEIEVISLEMGVVLAAPYFLVECGAGVYGNLIHVLLHHIQRLLRLLCPGLHGGQNQHRKQY